MAQVYRERRNCNPKQEYQSLGNRRIPVNVYHKDHQYMVHEAAALFERKFPGFLPQRVCDCETE